MAVAVVGGAALGAAFVEGFVDLHVTVKGAVRKKNPKFSSLLFGRLKYELDHLAPIIKDVKQLDCSKGEKTRGLIKLMKMGEETVRIFLNVWSSNFCYKGHIYRGRLIELMDSIVRFCLVDLQILPTIRPQIWETVQMHCPGFEFIGNCIYPVIVHQSLEILVSLPINSQWQRGNLVGRGSFGSVYIATNRNTRALCAIKEVEIFPDDKKSAVSIKQLWQEIKLLRKLKHPNIVQYYDSEIDDSWFRIYLELVPGGSIRKYIEDNGAIPESDIRRFTTHILFGLDYLHSKNIVHRDIKGANLLIDSFGVVRLADFGTAKHLALHADAAKLYLIGTAHWTAPELVRALEPSSPDVVLAVDIWSVGCTVLEMLTGRFPWGDLQPNTVRCRLYFGKTPPIPETLSSEVKEFLRCCLQIDPADRPSAARLLKHPFLKN